MQTTAPNKRYDPATFSKAERSILLYLETVAVDYCGLAEGQRMNKEDYEAIDKLAAEGFLQCVRVPMAFISEYTGTRKPTHFVQFTPLGWEVAHAVRRAAGERRREQNAQGNGWTARLIADLKDRGAIDG